MRIFSLGWEHLSWWKPLRELSGWELNTWVRGFLGQVILGVDFPTQSEIYRGIFDYYGGASGNLCNKYYGHYVGQVQILNV